uniref:Osteoclast-stimulating factor 1 n=1 Tax=Mola mola TaxID=94237 RepID=A0A3Q4ACK0_MOLML
MKEQKFQEEAIKIIEEAPNARRALLENYDNLLKVADYCYDNYVQSGDDDRKVLEETKNFTTQSLASVAYQISTLANSVLSLLDAQTNQLRHMESSINLIGLTVEMHKEKVSRREIGAFTAVKRVPRSHKILPPAPPPAGTQPRPPYSRRPINYQQLDGLGHGMKEVCVCFRPSKSPEPVQCPVAPPVCSCSALELVRHWFRLSAPVSGNLLLRPPFQPPVRPRPRVTSLQASVTDLSGPPPAPPLILETGAVFENSFPSPSPPPPPPPSDEDAFPPLPNDGSELPAPPPSQEVDGICFSVRLSVLPLSLFFFAGVCLAVLFHCSFFSDLEIPAPPPPLLLDDEACFDDIVAPLPPPVGYDICASLQYLDKVVALYDYEASKPDDLSLTRGDVIYLTYRHDSGWCEGVLNGNRGFFPENYVQSCDKAAGPPAL